MRDTATDRDWYTRARKQRNLTMGVPHDAGLRCPVCRAEYRGLTQHSTPGVSPRGRELYVVTCPRHYCRSRAHEFAFWPQDQTAFGAKGNCFSTCVAMLLEIPVAEVPWFMAEPTDQWSHRFARWVSTRGYNPVYHDANKPPRGFSILSGLSPTYTGVEKYHSIIAYNGRPIFDPSWKRTEVLNVLDWVTLEPARCVVRDCGKRAIPDDARGHTFCETHARDGEIVALWDNL